jgi:vitamin B12 transporter
MRSFITICVLCHLASAAFAQPPDTLYLKEVEVYGLPVTAYGVGSKVEKITTGDRVATLGDGLGGEASIYLKSYGNNQLTTIALRGTTASQTAVLWNGININSPTLGQTDFSLIPLFLFDEMSIHYGAGSSLYGSDAIGGSVMVGHSQPAFEKAPSISVYQQAGSFGRFASGIKTSYGNERWQFRTKVYRSTIANNFSYQAPAVGYTKNQTHAAVTNYGIDQQAFFKISEEKTMSAEVMYTNNFRQIQPAVTSREANETLKDQSLRIALNYNQDASWGILRATAAYMNSVQDYTNDKTSTALSDQFTGMIHVSKSINQRADVRYGLNFNQYAASSDNFSHAHEQRYDAFSSFRYAFTDRWITNVNVRQSVYAHRYAPLSPSIGTELYLRRQENRSVMLRGQIARGFRVPTLNDRYWVPTGNPFTKPEDARNVEAGIVWSRIFGKTHYKVDGTAYESWIDQMIVWQPNDEGLWSPSNLQKVNIKGLEFSSRFESQFKRFQLKMGADYSFTQSLNKAGDPALVNKQLAYVPLHSARFFGALSTDTNWSFGVNFMQTGIRYTTLDNKKDYQSSLKAYGLTDIFLTKKYALSRLSLEAKADVKNLMNVYYETLKNHAMPGRNYAISLLINFKHQPLHEKR